MTKNEQEILSAIIRKLKENSNSIKLERQQKFLLVERIVYKVHLYMCEKIREREKEKVRICGTGLESRIQRCIPGISFQIDDIQILVLAFEFGVLKDDELYPRIKEIYNVSDGEIEQALRIVGKKCPRPFFHRKMDLE